MEAKKLSKLFNTQVDGSLKISVDSELYKTISKAKTWYTNKNLSYIGIVVLAIIDIAGFLQAVNDTVNVDVVQRGIIVSGFAIAFEVAPLYIGYALSLKCYDLGKRIHNWVLAFATIACFLGMVGNIVFRSLTMDVAGDQTNVLLALTITMCILPVITSLVNLVIGCLTFDPLLFDLSRIEKKLRVMKIRKRQLESAVDALSDDESLINNLISEERECYQSTNNEIYAARLRFRTYIIARTSSIFEE